jgi:hypothetical protein
MNAKNATSSLIKLMRAYWLISYLYSNNMKQKKSTSNATLFNLVLDMAYSTISARFYSTLTLVMALSCLWMLDKKPFSYSNQ